MSKDKSPREIICPKCYETFEDTRKHRIRNFWGSHKCPECGKVFFANEGIARHSADSGVLYAELSPAALIVVSLAFWAPSILLPLWDWHIANQNLMGGLIELSRWVAWLGLALALTALFSIFDRSRQEKLTRRAAEKKAAKAKLAAGDENASV